MISLRDVDLNLLVVFQAVLTHRSISQAARELGLSQPAVSNGLARLRQTFDDELFTRTGAGMQPTPFAEALAEPVSVALAGISRAINHREAFDPASSQREFTLAMTDVGEVYFMPTLVDLCTRLAPRVHLRTVRTTLPDLKDAMASGRIDLAVGAFDDLTGPFFQRRLFRQQYVSLFRIGHALDTPHAGLAEFQAARHLFVATGDNPYARVNQLLAQAGFGADANVWVPHFIAVPYVVSVNDLVVTVPQKFAERAAAPFGLRFVKPPLRLPALQTNVFWHRRYHQDGGNQWLRQLISEHFAES
ncbi:LysR family transcriptional regulator [Pandoraea sp. XJJ-1]|uniref:LysR family transcriptional regulator n=1 Tax=Pandoraea sp. XJJ-1 TaxID=3002643 RepID=UPI00227DA10A|nr:LysR family transcriptional regulator [Pandoraea sp. XJJ-1]WAL80764.1 LysR family transcriptional regulator [Pandoraea sp. XJJ-1]